MSLKIGDKVLIIDAGVGAYGANGETGIVTKEKSDSGILGHKPGVNIKLKDGSVWRCRLDGKFSILSRKMSLTVSSHDDLTLAVIKEGSETKKGISIKNPKDDSDFRIGALIAIMRAMEMPTLTIEKVIDVLFEEEEQEKEKETLSQIAELLSEVMKKIDK